MKRTLIAAAALALAAAFAGCGGEPSSDPSKSASPTASPTADPTWDNEFSPEQMANYEAARTRWEEFFTKSNEARRRGKDSPETKAMFNEYSLQGPGEYSVFLDLYVNGKVRLEVPPKVLWTNASKIEGNTVIFNYCLDQTDMRIVNAEGDVNPSKPPYLRLITVQMEKTSKGWKQRGYLNQNKVRECARTAP